MTSASHLQRLTRKRDREADLAVLREVFDRCQVATVSTVFDDQPLPVPMLVARDGDRLLLHASTGAGAMRHIAAGAPVAVSAFLLDGLVIAERQFDHSANYRSAVVRGTCRVVDRAQLAADLDRFTDTLIPGRSRECPRHSAAELAATLLLELPIVDGGWLAKARTGPAAETAGAWTAVVALRRHYAAPQTTSPLPVPASVSRLLDASTG